MPGVSVVLNSNIVLLLADDLCNVLSCPMAPFPTPAVFQRAIHDVITRGDTLWLGQLDASTLSELFFKEWYLTLAVAVLWYYKCVFFLANLPIERRQSGLWGIPILQTIQSLVRQAALVKLLDYGASIITIRIKRGDSIHLGTVKTKLPDSP